MIRVKMEEELAMMSSQRYFQSWIKKNVVKVNCLWGQSITNSKPPFAGQRSLKSGS